MSCSSKELTEFGVFSRCLVCLTHLSRALCTWKWSFQFFFFIRFPALSFYDLPAGANLPSVTNADFKLSSNPHFLRRECCPREWTGVRLCRRIRRLSSPTATERIRLQEGNYRHSFVFSDRKPLSTLEERKQARDESNARSVFPQNIRETWVRLIRKAVQSSLFYPGEEMINRNRKLTDYFKAFATPSLSHFKLIIPSFPLL